MRTMAQVVLASLSLSVNSMADAADLSHWIALASQPDVTVVLGQVKRIGFARPAGACGDTLYLVQGEAVVTGDPNCRPLALIELEVGESLRGGDVRGIAPRLALASPDSLGELAGARGLFALRTLSPADSRWEPASRSTVTLTGAGSAEPLLDVGALSSLEAWLQEADATAAITAIRRGPAYFRVDEPSAFVLYGGEGGIRALASAGAADRVTARLNEVVVFEGVLVNGVAAGRWVSGDAILSHGVFTVDFFLGGDLAGC